MGRKRRLRTTSRPDPDLSSPGLQSPPSFSGPTRVLGGVSIGPATREVVDLAFRKRGTDPDEEVLEEVQGRRAPQRCKGGPLRRNPGRGGRLTKRHCAPTLERPGRVREIDLSFSDV